MWRWGQGRNAYILFTQPSTELEVNPKFNEFEWENIGRFWRLKGTKIFVYDQEFPINC